MLEFQASMDWLLALRTQSYAARIYERMPDSRRSNSEFRLPPILTVVVCNGPSPWRAARCLSDLVEPKPFRAHLHGFDLFFALPYSNDMGKWTPEESLRAQYAFWSLPDLGNDYIPHGPR